MPTRQLEDVLKEVRRIQIVARRQVNDLLAGEYLSVFKGRGMEFDAVREYVPGDEIRAIDWNVTAQHRHAVRENVLRGARADRASGGRYLGVGLIWLLSSEQDGDGRRGGGRAHVHRAAQPRQGGPPLLYRRRREVHPAAQRARERAALDPRAAGHRAHQGADRYLEGARVPWAGSAAALLSCL